MNTIELTIKAAPIFKGKIWKKQIEFTQSKFADDTLQAVAFSKDGLQQLYVFNKRVYFNEIKGMLSNNEQSIPFGNISSVECNSKGLFASIVITTSGANIVINDVSVGIAQVVAKIIEDLRSAPSGVTPKATLQKDTFDLADEIRELKDLLDDGLITQDEFDTKKKQLLNI